LAKYNGLVAEPLYRRARGPRVRRARRLRVVGRTSRIEQASRADRQRTRADGPPVKLVIAGPAPIGAGWTTSSAGSISATGSRSPAISTIGNWSACKRNALAVVYPPIDEDYGYVTLEAFLALTVVTTTDAGGPRSSKTVSVASWLN
jgi:glycosyltransferase involved in cell wall biosynthesis